WLTASSAANERRHVLKRLTATLSLAAAGCATTSDPKNAMTTPDLKSAAIALLDETISIDLHSHPGMVRTLARATMDGHIIDHLSRMADAVGVDHVAIGTDMEGIPVQFCTFDNYSEWPSIATACSRAATAARTSPR